MPNEETLVHRDAEWRLQQARALLDLFEHDCGRPAATLDEFGSGHALKSKCI